MLNEKEKTANEPTSRYSEQGQSFTSGYKEHVKYTSEANWSMTATHCNVPYFVSSPSLRRCTCNQTRKFPTSGGINIQILYLKTSHTPWCSHTGVTCSAWLDLLSGLWELSGNSSAVGCLWDHRAQKEILIDHDYKIITFSTLLLLSHLSKITRFNSILFYL